MNLLGKIFRLIFRIILPAKVYFYLASKISRTKTALSYTRELRVFWKILKIILLPVTFSVSLLLSLLVALVKTILIWILPTRIYYNIRYLVRQFCNDIMKRSTGLCLAWKRVLLCNELFVKGAEKKVSYGEKNPDKTFYVLRPYYYLQRNELTLNISNLLSHYYRNLQHLAYAVEKGWVPVVDWENYGPFPHGEDYPVNGTKNCWEYYWEQPSSYTLSEVYQSKNVVLSIRNTRDNPYTPSAFFHAPLQKQAEDYAKRCPKYDQLIKLNHCTDEYIRRKQKGLFPPNARILGVSVRGVSYGILATSKDIGDHPVQPDFKKLIESVKIALEEWEMDYVFFACELESAVEMMRESFKEKLIVFDRKRYQKPPTREDVDNGNDPLYVPGQRYQTNLDYLTEIVLLSRCTSLLAAMSGGVRAALIWNNQKYEKIKIFENGLW